jgi:hypothetical protein
MQIPEGKNKRYAAENFCAAAKLPLRLEHAAAVCSPPA